MTERNTAPAGLQAEGAPPASAPAAPAAPAAPRSAGQMLRELRESAGVDPALLASALKITTQKLDALEHDRLDELPDVTFARGLASAICRAFGADPAPVLERMPVSAPGLRAGAQQINEPFRRASDRPAPMLASNFSKPLVIAVLVLLVGAAVLWFLPTLPVQLSAPGNAEAPEGSASAPVAATEPIPAELPLGAASAEQGAAPAPEPASAPASAALAAATAGGDLIQFVAKAETWVTVRDAAGKAIFNRALTSGETVGVTGSLPLSVTVGRKDAVDVRVRGEPFDIRALSKTTVARFQVK